MGFSDELWDGFDKVTDRVMEGKKFTVEFAAFAKKRIAIERDYARQLQALVKSSKATEIGSLDGAWSALKAETDSIANYHLTFADSLTSQVDESLKQWINETKKQRKQLRTTGKKLIADFGSTKKEVEKAMAGYEASRKKQDATQTEANNDSSNPKVAKKLLSDTKAAEKADEAYKKAVEKMKVMEGRYYDSELPQILRDYEAMEVARVKLLKSALTNFAEAQAAIPPKAKNSAEVMKAKADAVNVDGDIEIYITNAKTGQPKPSRTQYQPYDSVLGACKPVSGGGGGGGGGSYVAPASSGGDSGRSVFSPPSGGSGKAPTPFSAPARTPPSGFPAGGGFGGGGGGGGGNPPATSPRGPAGGGGGGGASSNSSFKVKALYSYTGQENTELSFDEGDIITVTYKDESGWWEGELKGRVGVFPSNHVEVLGAGGGGGGGGGGAGSATNAPYEEACDKCKALYEYKAEDADELTIKEGDILTIDDEDDEGWYYGTNSKGEYGKFPSNYVELLPK